MSILSENPFLNIDISQNFHVESVSVFILPKWGARKKSKMCYTIVLWGKSCAQQKISKNQNHSNKKQK